MEKLQRVSSVYDLPNIYLAIRVLYGMEGRRTDGWKDWNTYFLGTSRCVKKKQFILWTNSKGSHLVRNKEPSPVVSCTENAVTEKCHKEEYVEERAYFDLLRIPAVYIR